MTTLPSITWERKGDTHIYQVTDDDRLTLIRAVAHEGKPYLAVAWCLLQRFCWLYPSYDSFARFIKAYAQPINPRWFPDGDLHQKARARAGADLSRIADLDRRAARRVQYAKQPIEQIDAKYIEVVDALLCGRTQSPCKGAIHYSASFAKPKHTDQQAFIAASRFAKQRHIGPVVHIEQGFRRGINWFFAAGGSLRVDMHIGFVIEVEMTVVPDDPEPEQDCVS
jgi:hypothetical protein